MYYNEPIPSEAPEQVFLVVVYFVIVFFGLWYVQRKFKDIKNTF